MRKILKKAAAFLLAFAILFSITTVDAEAATKIVTIKSGKTYKMGKYPMKQVFKVTVKKETTLKLDISNNNANYLGLEIYTDKKLEKNIANDRLINSTDTITKKHTAYISLKKGTYYLRFSAIKSSQSIQSKAKIKVTFKYPSQEENYCMDEAVSWKVNTNLGIAAYFDSNYTRWYRIDVTKLCKVKIESTIGLFSTAVNVLDGEGNTCYLSQERATIFGSNGTISYTTQNDLEPGTYYVAIRAHNRGSLRGKKGIYSEVKWSMVS